MSAPPPVVPPDEPLLELPANLAPVHLLPLDDDLKHLPPLPNALPPRQPFSLRRCLVAGWRTGTAALGWCFGVAALIFGLAFLAAIPVFGFLSLGYLLETGGRIIRHRAARDALAERRCRWRISRFFLRSWLAWHDGLIGVRQASRVGGMALGVTLMVLPLQVLSSLYASAEIIEPGGLTARRWQAALTWLTVAVGIHIGLACLRGGRVRYFLWPIGNLIWLVRQLARGPLRCYREACDGVWDFVVSLRLPYYFWLGARGFFAALAWLVVPISLMAVGRKLPPLGLLGASWLVGVLLVLPFLQIHFAAQRRFLAGFELGTVLTRFGQAPWAFALAQFLTLLLSLPLYLFKIEFIPNEVGGWPSVFVVLVCLVFVVFIYPTRLLTAWAYACAERRARPSNPFFAATALLGMIPLTAAYVGFVFLTQYTSWKGFASLYEQHAFLLPVPFPGW